MLAIHSVWAKLLYVRFRIIWQTKLLHPCATFSGLFLTHFLCVFEFGNDIGKTLKTTSFFSVIFPRFVCAHSLLYSFPFIFSLRRASPRNPFLETLFEGSTTIQFQRQYAELRVPECVRMWIVYRFCCCCWVRQIREISQILQRTEYEFIRSWCAL